MLFSKIATSRYRQVRAVAIATLALASMLLIQSCGTPPPPPPQGSVAVTPNPASVQVGSTIQLDIIGTDPSGIKTDLTSMAIWQSSDTSVATVTNGKALGVAVGNVTITATDGGFSGTTKLTVEPPLAIATASLPNGTVNTAYPTTNLQATGGTPPYSWSLSTGTLPTGLSLNPGGTLSGTPTAAGSSTFTVQVADSVNPPQTAKSQSFTVTIAGQTAQSVIFASGGLVALDANGTIAAVGNGITGVATVFQKDGQGNWSQAAQLTNSDKALASIAISGDGSTIVVGSCSNASCKGHGFVYVASSNGANQPDWTLALKNKATLSASNAQVNGGDRVGFSVATDKNGDTVAVGAPCDYTAAILLCGTVYVYDQPGASWSSKTEDAQLTVSGTPTVSLAVSMDAVGETIIAGSPGTEAGNNTPGAVYVFVKHSGWHSTSSPDATLTGPSPATNGDFLGFSAHISADGHTVVGGAYNFAGCSPQPCHAGAAFVWSNAGLPAAWSSKAADAMLQATSGFDKEAVGFASAVSNDGSKVIVGASGFGILTAGKVYVFQRSGNSWTGTQNETLILTSSAGTALGGQSVTPSAAFGFSLSISADGATVAGGGQATVGATANQGVIYVFQ
jgi:hypothetical protein